MHSIIAIHIDKDTVILECECGWKSTTKTSESEARLEHDIHITKAEE